MNAAEARPGKRLYIKTFGCQMNVYDSLKIASVLRSSDYRPADAASRADLILVNTCSVREKAVQKLYSTLGHYKRLKRRNPRLLIGVAGCVAQQEKRALLDRFPYLDLVVGPDNIGSLPGLIADLEANRRPVSLTDLMDGQEGFSPDLEADLVQGVTGFITVMKGCNKACTYCIVPFVRGREFSRPPDEILAEAEKMASRGVREITLLGQNVNAYRYRGVGLARLLEMAGALPGVDRLRFTTSHPQNLTKDLIACFGRLDKLCNHLHLPVQSGSDRVLGLMRRTYTQAWYLRKIDFLRRIRPDIALSTDIIVGFPGESEDDFQETLRLLDRVRFDGIFSFHYSPRKYTQALALGDPVPAEEKSRRLKLVQELQAEITLEKNRELVGRTEEILVEGASKNRPDELFGRTTTHRVVNFPAHNSLIGRIVRVRIQEAYANSLRGRLS